MKNNILGETQNSLRFQFKIAQCTIGNIIIETCKAIINVLHNKYVKFPSTTQQWITIADEFEINWGFPNVLGAVDDI